MKIKKYLTVLLFALTLAATQQACSDAATPASSDPTLTVSGAAS